MPSSIDQLVTLRGGFVVPVSVIEWLINAEGRKRRLHFNVDGERLIVQPAEAVSAEDDRFIREHRDLLRACVAYIATVAQEPL